MRRLAYALIAVCAFGLGLLASSPAHTAGTGPCGAGSGTWQGSTSVDLVPGAGGDSVAAAISEAEQNVPNMPVLTNDQSQSLVNQVESADAPVGGTVTASLPSGTVVSFENTGHGYLVSGVTNCESEQSS